MRYLVFMLGLLLAAGNFVFAQKELQPPQLPAANVTVAQEKAAEVTQPAPLEPEPVMEIKQLEVDKPLYSFELRDVEIGDLLRVLAHDYKLNLLVDKEVEGKVTASLSSISLEEALETIAESQNLSLKKKGNVILVSPDVITRIFTLKFIEAREILESASSSNASSDTSGTPPQGSGQETAQAASKTTQTQSASSAGSETNAQSLPNTIYDLLSEKGKILLGKQPNSLVVMDYPSYVEKVAAYLKEIDQKMDSKVFKLKYLKAADVVGQGNANTTSTAGTSYNSSNTTAAAGS